jgi:hypothetical protein
MEPPQPPPLSEPAVDIAFDCLPLRTVSRLDVPLDASEALRRRAEHMKSAISAFGLERSYFLYNARCVFRFANSEVDGICRFEFEGAVQTDAGDRKCERTMLEVRLISETCGGLPAEIEVWLADRVRQAVAIEFDRFIAAGQHTAGEGEADKLGSLSQLSGLSGMDV